MHDRKGSFTVLAQNRMRPVEMAELMRVAGMHIEYMHIVPVQYPYTVGIANKGTPLVWIAYIVIDPEQRDRCVTKPGSVQ